MAVANTKTDEQRFVEKTLRGVGITGGINGAIAMLASILAGRLILPAEGFTAAHGYAPLSLLPEADHLLEFSHGHRRGANSVPVQAGDCERALAAAHHAQRARVAHDRCGLAQRRLLASQIAVLARQ